MIISKSNVSMRSIHQETTIAHKEESFRSWVDGASDNKPMGPKGGEQLSIHRIIDEVKLSAEDFSMAHSNLSAQSRSRLQFADKMKLIKKLQNCASGSCAPVQQEKLDEPYLTDSQVNLLKHLVEMLWDKEKIEEINVDVNSNRINESISFLPSRNVGAIYLGHANTDFQYHGSTGALLGQTVSTDISLSESGQEDTVQQIDVVS